VFRNGYHTKEKPLLIMVGSRPRLVLLKRVKEGADIIGFLWFNGPGFDYEQELLQELLSRYYL
jgi:hypothetical protein